MLPKRTKKQFSLNSTIEIFSSCNKDVTLQVMEPGILTPCPIKIHNPEMCLVVDEVNSHFSQKGDGHIGGTKYSYGKGTYAQIKVQHIDKHSTLHYSIVLTSEHVMYLVIFVCV